MAASTQAKPTNLFLVLILIYLFNVICDVSWDGHFFRFLLLAKHMYYSLLFRILKAIAIYDICVVHQTRTISFLSQFNVQNYKRTCDEDCGALPLALFS